MDDSTWSPVGSDEPLNWKKNIIYNLYFLFEPLKYNFEHIDPIFFKLNWNKLEYDPLNNILVFLNTQKPNNKQIWKKKINK